MKPSRSEQLFRQREAVRLARQSLKCGKAHCEGCGQKLQVKVPQYADYGYIVRGHISCVACISTIGSLPIAECSEEDMPRSAVAYDKAAKHHEHQRFYDDIQAARLRSHLVSLSPECVRCGRRLHARKEDHDLSDYAHVVTGRLSCKDCVKALSEQLRTAVVPAPRAQERRSLDQTLRELELRELAQLEPRLSELKEGGGPKANDPRPEDLLRTCAEIRAGWSQEETWRRSRSDVPLSPMAAAMCDG